MMTPPEQAQFLVWLAELIGAEEILEVGTFTGYMTLWFALNLPEGGSVTTLDLNTDSVEIGRKYWGQAGMLKRIHFVEGAALKNLQSFQEEGRHFDFAYLDADKSNYPHYLESIYELLRPSGVLVIDNVLWGGRVADPGVNDPDTEALRIIAVKLQKDPRFSTSMIPIGDGLLLCRKR
jgi:predicted O-methyltransferase YrrM